MHAYSNSARKALAPLLLLAVLCGTLPAARAQASGAAPPGPVTARRLLNEMTDLGSMAEFPIPAFTTHQASSYDRRSTRPGSEEWFANDDWGRFLRVEERNGRQEQVMMDTKGPGAVVRIWSANPSGTLRIYLDGDAKPAIEAKMGDLLDGKVEGLPAPLAGVRARGHNLYFPIPYARSCKITCDEGRPYYVVNYRTYAEGTTVETFRADDIKALESDIRSAAAKLAAPRGGGIWPDDVKSFRQTLAPGATVTLAGLKGPRAITQLVVRPQADDSTTALRGLVLRMSFDGKQTVEAPLGDFFGSAPGFNSFATLPTGSTEWGELWSQWVMPFRSSARVQVVNLGTAPVTLSGQVGSAPYSWTDNSMHFGAGYTSRYDVKTRPISDLTHLQAEGKGVFAGISIAVDNPVHGWWGEGDEKIYVDGESFPSFFGTGTEDYFGYAWCDPAWFTHAFHSQPHTQSGHEGLSNGPPNFGRFSNNRFHIIDRIPFTTSIKFDMELWHWEEASVNVASVAYWYAAPGMKTGFAPLKPADLVVRPLEPYKPMRVEGALEGEEMEVLRKTASAAPQGWTRLSGDSHLWWHNGPKVGDTLTLRFRAPRAGRYRVAGRFMRAKDYGIHQLAINGEKAGGPLDFYNPDVSPSSEMDLGTFDLKEGANELTVTVVGANEKAEKGYMFGLDYLLLKPAER